MIRIRTTVLMWVFCTIGYASTGRGAYILIEPRLLVCFAVIAFWYAFSTTCNDLSDEEIDKINLKDQNAERPLVLGSSNKKELLTVGVLSAVVGIGCAAVIGKFAVAATVLALLYGAIYSLRPIRISYRGILAPLTLPLVYIIFTFMLGRSLINTTLNAHEYYLIALLYFGFFGRIVLKDLRDVKGDKKFGKRTFTVRYGVKATAIMSAFAWVCSGIFSVLYFMNIVAIISVWVLIGFIFYALLQMWQSKLQRDQLVLVAVIGRLGNGVAIIALTFAIAGITQGRLAFLLLGIAVLHIAMAKDTWIYHSKWSRT